MRNLLIVLVMDGLLVVSATINQVYQGWLNRKALIPEPVIPELGCFDSITVTYPGERLSDTNWKICHSNQNMRTEYLPTVDVRLPYLIVYCDCKEDVKVDDTGI